MKNENNHEVEKLLKDKMNELSESVDCFDRISARAFPEKDEDFSESGFTVSDLENVTGKAKKISVIKWTAIAAAAVVCIIVIPQTNLIGNIISNISSGSVMKNYENLISEIDAETKNGDYLIADYPLDYYIKNDVLVTPLFACPFEDCGKEDVSVRIYTRQINGINTNQVYAVEYKGDFSEENIIAAAQSEYTFSEEDVEYAKKFSRDDFPEYYDCTSVVGKNFGTNSDGLFIDSDGNTVSVASFVSFTLMKYDSGIIPVESTILYGHETMTDDSYFYDIISISDNEKIQITEREKAWKKSVYFNNNTAMPEENHSMFSEKDLFNSSSEIISECMFVTSLRSSDKEREPDETVSIYNDYSGKRLCAITVPYDDIYLSETYLYFAESAFEDEISVSVKSSELSYTYSFAKFVSEYTSSAYEEISKNAEQNPLSSVE